MRVVDAGAIDVSFPEFRGLLERAARGAGVIVTIDGPAGAGKSTVAKALAERLGYRLLDTGAMYRAVTLEALRTGGDPVAIARGEAWRTHLDDPALRGDDVNDARVRRGRAARGARGAARRPARVPRGGRRRGRGARHRRRRVAAGRAEGVARRRPAASVRAAGGGEGAAALERDRRDAAQTIVPEGSVRIDTTGLSVDEVVDRIEELVR